MKKMKEYLYHAGLNMRGYPSNKQRRNMYLIGRASEYVYNKCVGVDQELYELKKVKTYVQSVADRINYLKSFKGNFKRIANVAPFLEEEWMDSQAGACAISNYNNAWENYRKDHFKGIPTFHKKQAEVSYQTSSHYKDGKITGAYFVDESHICLPKIGVIRVKNDKEYVKRMLSNTERFGTFTVTLKADGSCYISAQLGSDTPFKEAYEHSDDAVGIDMNVRNFCADSEGNMVDNPKYYTKAQEKLAKEQRKLSLKLESAKKDCPKNVKLSTFLKGRKAYQKQRRKVAHLYSNVSNQRDNFLRDKANDYAKSHGIIIVEDLKIKNLLKNHCLAKSISDVSWGTFLVFLEQECAWRGRTFMKIPPQLTTQTCSCCGHVLPVGKRLTLKDEEWTCPSCGTYHIRDVNAAINIKKRGLAMLNS